MARLFLISFVSIHVNTLGMFYECHNEYFPDDNDEIK